MASETERKTSMRRIRNPDDNSQYVDVKVIDEISFFDAKSAQEYRFVFNNHEDADRKVHVVTVKGTKEDEEDPDFIVRVERIDEFGILDQKSDAQEYRYVMTGNKDEPPVHAKTHKFKIHHKETVDGEQRDLWIEMQRIDELSISDAKENGQERIFTLDWPDDDEKKKDPVDSTSDNTSINPPWRFDPFQDVTDVRWAEKKEPPEQYPRYQVLATDFSNISNQKNGSGLRSLTFFPYPVYYTPAGAAQSGITDPNLIRPFPVASPLPVIFWQMIAEFSEDPFLKADPTWAPQPDPNSSAPFSPGPIFFYRSYPVEVDTGCSKFSFGQLIGFQKRTVGTGDYLSTRSSFPKFLFGNAADAQSIVSAGGTAVITSGQYTYSFITSPENPALADAICVQQVPSHDFGPNLFFYAVPPPPKPPNGGGGGGGPG